MKPVLHSFTRLLSLIKLKRVAPNAAVELIRKSVLPDVETSSLDEGDVVPMPTLPVL